MRQLKIWIAWAPSSWKSSLLDFIKERSKRHENGERNTNIVEEPASKIIRQRIALWESLEDILSDPVKFQSEIHRMKVSDFLLSRWWSHIYFDTTLVEDIAHRQVSWVETKSIQDAIDKYRYDHIFYLSHPWSVENNWIRVENESEVWELDRLKRQAFIDNGYDIREVPTFLKEGDEINRQSIDRAVYQRQIFIGENS